MKKTLQSLVSVTAFFINAGCLMAQQDPYVTHYMFNRTMYNPAAVGAGGKFCLTALSHYQYTAFEDRTPEFHPLDKNQPNGPTGNQVKSVGPKTQMFSFSAPINYGFDANGEHINYGGIGVAFMNDKLGYELSTNIKVQACGRLPFSSGAALALGFEVDFLQKGVDGGRLRPLAPGDPRVPAGTVKDMHPNYVAGLYFHNPMTNSGGTLRDLWVGVSGSNLKKTEYSYTDGISTPIYTTVVAHYYLMGGVTMTDFMSNPNLELLPSIMYKRMAVNQIEGTALLRYQKKLWGGISYRSTVDAFSIILGYQVNNEKSKLHGLRIGYSYDLTLSKVINVSSGTHELQLNYCFDISIPKPPIKRILNPRHLDRNPNLD